MMKTEKNFIGFIGMKSKISVVLIALIGITGYFITQKPQAPESFTKDEISKQRAEWWKKKLADPATGEIPQDIISKEAIFAQTLPKDSDFGSRGEDSLIYEPRGPYNTGGRIRSLGIDKANTNILISGGVSGGIYRSTNAGQSWEKVSLQNQSHNISYIVQDKRAGKTNIWYAGTGEGSG